MNLELRRVMAERDRLKRMVESQENELKAMDKVGLHSVWS